MKNLIEKINKSEAKLVLATGRMFMGADFVAQKFNLKTPVVCYQGAVVRTKEEILWQSLIENNLAREILKYLKEKGIQKLYVNFSKETVSDYNQYKSWGIEILDGQEKINSLRTTKSEEEIKS